MFGLPLKTPTLAPPWILYMVSRPMILAFSLILMVMRRRRRVDHCWALSQSWAPICWVMGMNG